MDQTFHVQTGQGQTHELRGDPSQLTLRQAIDQSLSPSAGSGQWSGSGGKKGGASGSYKCRVNGQEYTEKDFQKSFSSLGINEGDTIEVLEAVS